VRDGIFLAKAGHPAVVIVQGPFERAARAQAKVLGLPDLKIYVYQQHDTGHLGSAERDKGVAAVQEIRQMLEG
jgi:hypothetical protein